jgi:hypothetical protein
VDKNGDSKKCPVVRQPDVNGIAGTGLPDKDDESSRDNKNGEPSQLPFEGMEFYDSGQDYSETINPRHDEKKEDFEIYESSHGDLNSLIGKDDPGGPFGGKGRINGREIWRPPKDNIASH